MDWNSEGSHDNTTPLAGGSEVLQEKSSDALVEGAVKGTRLKFLDITALLGETRGPHITVQLSLETLTCDGNFSQSQS